jgi:MFS family permease
MAFCCEIYTYRVIMRHRIRRQIGVVSLTETAQRATYREVFGVAEFRSLWLAQLLSVIGDQLAKVALTLLVYDQTHSALLAAVTFAASFVPTFLGGVVLAGVADRISRRAVMIACDVIRGLLVAVMAVPGVPLAVLVILLFVVTMFSTPFTSARAAVYPDVLSGDRYVIGTAVTLTTFQLAQVIGFAVGGGVVGLFGARPALIADALTFAASALLVRFGVRSRAVPREETAKKSPVADLVAGTKLVFTNPALRTPMLYGWLCAFYNAPEGIAAPFARQLHAGATGVGLLLAAGATGYTVGAAAFGRLAAPGVRQRLMAPLSTGCSLILVLIALRPGLPVALLILAVSGMCACFQVAANSAFVVATPPAQRSQAFGLATGGMSLGQGVAFVLAGAAAQHFTPVTVIVASGVLGTLAAVAITLGSARHPPS